MKGRVASLTAAALLAACAPRIEAPGPVVITPTIADDHILAADGVRLPLRIWPAEGRESAVVLAVHGFNDHSTAFDDAATELAPQGITVYAYDQRGFGATDPEKRGLWPGVEAFTGDLRAAAALLRPRHPDVPFYLLGESMGGAVVMTAMTGPEPPVTDGIILVAPAVWGRATMPWYQRVALAVASHTVPWMKLTGEGLNIRASDNDEMLRKLSRDPLFIKKTRVDAIHGITDLMDAALAAAPDFDAPALILYGEKDEIIPREPTLRMLKSLPAAAAEHRKIALYEGGYHMLLRDLEGATVWRDIAAWIAEPDAPLPSGADAHAATVLAGDGRG